MKDSGALVLMARTVTSHSSASVTFCASVFFYRKFSLLASVYTDAETLAQVSSSLCVCVT